jgi:hypothetical protein
LFHYASTDEIRVSTISLSAAALIEKKGSPAFQNKKPGVLERAHICNPGGFFRVFSGKRHQDSRHEFLRIGIHRFQQEVTFSSRTKQTVMK